MFERLGEKLSGVFDSIRKRGVLSDKDVDNALREVRIALLEADVALPVVKDFISQVKVSAIGEKVINSVAPGQMVVKIVHEHLTELLGGGSDSSTEISFSSPPSFLMLVGLQGSGKTTTAAKLGKYFSEKRKKVLMVSLDTRRPAAMEQLQQLGKQINIPTLEIIKSENPEQIAKRSLEEGRLGGYDVVILDTAGRNSLDEELMNELVIINDIVSPKETLLVADSMTGQDAVKTAEKFREAAELTGIILTRVDGDTRGGAALSMHQVTKKPIKFLGVGEKIDALEVFSSKRVAGRILGMDDVVGFVEQAQKRVDSEEAEKLASKIAKGVFTLDDFMLQIRQMRRMGGTKGIMGLLPSVAKLKKSMQDSQVDDKALARVEAVVSSMTRAERKNIKLLNGSRKRRIASGSGNTVQEVNKVIKQYKDMQTLMKHIKKKGVAGVLGNIPGIKLPPSLAQ